MSTNAPQLTPQQAALNDAIGFLKGCIAALNAYLIKNANNMDDPTPLQDCVQELQNLQVSLTLASIFIGVDVHQQDLDDLKAISKKLKQQLDTIDVDIARAKQVIAIGIAALALVKSLIPAIDPTALAAAVRQAGAALKPVKAPGSTG